MKEKQIDKKHLFALYSNIAILNAVSYIQINENNFKLKESDLDKEFKLNNVWKNLVTKINKWKKENDTLLEEEKVAKFIAQYLRFIRNFYSHSENYKKFDDKNNELSYKKNKKNLKTFEYNADVENYLNKIFKGLNFSLSHSSEQEEKQLFIIILFLNKSELNDLKDDLKNNFANKFSKIISILSYDKTHLKYAFKNYKYQSQNDIHHKVINYLKNFNNTKNRKIAFLNLANDLLNFQFNKSNFKFSKNISDDPKKNSQNRYFLTIQRESKNKIDAENKLDFASVKFLMLLENKEKIKKLLFEALNKIKDQENQKLFEKKFIESNKIINYQSFYKRYSQDSKINNRHLLKTLNKVNNVFNKDNEDYLLKQYHFEVLYQSLNLKNIDLIDASLKEKLEKMLNFNFQKENITSDDLELAIKKYILKIVNNEEKFNTLFIKEKSDLKAPTRLPKPEFYLHVNYLKNLTIEKEELKNPFDSNLFNFKNLKNQNKQDRKINNDIKNYLAPIIMFYINNFHSSNKYFKLDNNFYKQFEVLDSAKIKYIFEKRIPYEQKEIIIKNNFNEDDFKIKNFNPEDMHLTINNKLFLQFMRLLEIKEIDQKEWKNIQNAINNHRKQELEIIEKVFNHDMGTINEQEIRNYFIHRTLNDIDEKNKLKGFKNFNQYQKTIETLLSLKKISLPTRQSKFKTNEDPFQEEDEAIEKHKYEDL